MSHGWRRKGSGKDKERERRSPVEVERRKGEGNERKLQAAFRLMLGPALSRLSPSLSLYPRPFILLLLSPFYQRFGSSTEPFQ